MFALLAVATPPSGWFQVRAGVKDAEGVVVSRHLTGTGGD